MALPHVTGLAGMACVVAALLFQAVRAFSLLGVLSMATCVGLFVLTVVKSDVIILGFLTALAAVGGVIHYTS
nr:hypothetical protein BaRGS_009776 [Batillaria attramentaria]